MGLSIAALASSHDLAVFTSGSEPLDGWLRKVAGQHQQKSLSKTFVLTEDQAPQVILGYYALAHRGLVERERLPADLAKRLPSKIPGFVLARLAISQGHQGRGFGAMLLMDALCRARQVEKSVGGPFMFVDAKDDAAADFYRHFGFQALPGDPLCLVLPLAVLGQELFLMQVNQRPFDKRPGTQ